MKNQKNRVEIVKLSCGYISGNKKRVISQNLNLTLSGGNLVALLGPNGCGKSTLLRTIAGLQSPLDGKVTIASTAISHLKSKEKARLLSLVLTDRVNAAHLIVKDIVGIGRYPYTGAMGILSPQDKEIVKEALEKCKIEEYSERPYAELSDGEKQRVLLARALAQDTPLMMLDEPTAHLDLPNRIELMKMLRDLAQNTNKAILLSTHELDLALQWCDEIWLMNANGQMQTGVPEDLVLNDSFSKIFTSESFFFDKTTGIFKIKRKPNGTVCLTGEKIRKTWTQRAIERAGFTVVQDKENTEFTIDAQPQYWQITQKDKTQTVSSIKELLSYIQDAYTTKD